MVVVLPGPNTTSAAHRLTVPRYMNWPLLIKAAVPLLPEEHVRAAVEVSLAGLVPTVQTINSSQINVAPLAILIVSPLVGRPLGLKIVLVW